MWSIRSTRTHTHTLMLIYSIKRTLRSYRLLRFVRWFLFRRRIDTFDECNEMLITNTSTKVTNERKNHLTLQHSGVVFFFLVCCKFNFSTLETRQRKKKVCGRVSEAQFSHLPMAKNRRHSFLHHVPFMVHIVKHSFKLWFTFPKKKTNEIIYFKHTKLH